MSEETKTGIIRDEQGRFVNGVSGNPDGRPPDTEEQIITKKAVKELIKEYKEGLADALEKVSPILIAEALKGNIQAIKEINDRVMGKPEQCLSDRDGNVILPIKIIIQKQDGREDEIQGGEGEVLLETI